MPVHSDFDPVRLRRVLRDLVAHALQDASGDREFIGAVSDITERKTTEEQLRWNAQELQRSEFYLAEGQRLGQAGSWALNPSGFFEYWSRELFQIYGLDPQKGAPTLEQYLATIHPQDRDFMAETIKRMCEQGSGCDAKKRSFDRTARFAIFDALVFQSSTTGFSKGFLAPPWM
jgi:PAS domain-containing protein